ncbi:hypothetical protein Sfulv_40350 [Streptomyces fulvorobeus]|uniref:Uncharacterized protein n=1 Tax=Streptomyces fulvorobeus TaxID=284028 RepID=A0A7J0CBQ1_9ACTN|nr:hypothetical protein Sfulv_40350 [Streptomyces fulvorobeus]
MGRRTTEASAAPAAPDVPDTLVAPAAPAAPAAPDTPVAPRADGGWDLRSEALLHAPPVPEPTDCSAPPWGLPEGSGGVVDPEGRAAGGTACRMGTATLTPSEPNLPRPPRLCPPPPALPLALPLPQPSPRSAARPRSPPAPPRAAPARGADPPTP